MRVPAAETLQAILAAAILACSPGRVFAAASEALYEIPFSVENEMIVVKGILPRAEGLRFIIDTGATSSVINEKIADRLGLKPEPGTYEVRAFGTTSQARKYRLAGIQFGTVFTTLHCLGVNLGGWGVDGVIGLDLLLGKTYIAHSVTHRVLEDHAFAIDYEAGVIRFGSTKPLHFSVPAEGDLSQIVVNASIEGKPLRLALDTGSQVTSLFRRSEKRWIPRLPVTGIMNVFHILGRSRARSVLIRDFALGDEHWPALNALLSDARNPSVDGLLAVSSLKLKTLQFESDRKILSWER